MSSTRKSRSKVVKVGSSSPKRVGEALAPALDRDRRVLHPGLEGGPGLGVEGAEDLVELDRLGDVGGGQRAAVGKRRVRRRWPGSARRRSRRAASWCAGSPAVRAGSARSGRSMSIVASACSPSGEQLDACHFADRDAGDPHVGLLGELGRLVEGDLELVGLRPERGRPAEGDPEEEQDAEARQREAGDDERAGLCWGLACSFGEGSAAAGRTWVGRDVGQVSGGRDVGRLQDGSEERPGGGEAAWRGWRRCR